jgi:hypothetical protein
MLLIVSTTPSGLVIVTLKPDHPYRAEYSCCVIPIRINVSWLTPTGLGVAPMTGKVFIVPCAVAAGKATSETTIESSRIKATVAEILFFGNCKLLFSPIFFIFWGRTSLRKCPSHGSKIWRRTLIKLTEVTIFNPCLYKK